MKLAITGHRNDKVGGWILPNPTYIYVCQQIEKQLKLLQPEEVLTGMCIGVDLWFAHIAHQLGIPFVACLPFEGQELKWSQADQKNYRRLRKRASKEVIVSPGGYAASKMQVRNQYLVDRSDKLLACWDGSNGGTKNCLDYAKSVGREMILIDPNKKIGVIK